MCIRVIYFTHWNHENVVEKKNRGQQCGKAYVEQMKSAVPQHAGHDVFAPIVQRLIPVVAYPETY